MNLLKRNITKEGSEMSTIELLNRLINTGAEKEFVDAVCAIWYLQANNDPNTSESQKIAGGIIGTLENFLVEEAQEVDTETFQSFQEIINKSHYGALFDDTQPIFTIGHNEVLNDFELDGSITVMELYSHYANVMLQNTHQNKGHLLNTLKALAEYVDHMCGLANKA